MSPCFDRDRAESPRFEAHGSILQYRVEPDALRRRSAIWELVGPNVRRLLQRVGPARGELFGWYQELAPHSNEEVKWAKKKSQ